MLKLETFGGLTLTDDAGQHVVSQRRRLALLALIASGGARGIPRDKLIACLWPESPSESARHALEQLLYSLRRQMPADALRGMDRLQLNAEVVHVDLTEFADRLLKEDFAGAVAVYRGPFLDGFFLGGSQEFDRWVERERTHLAAQHETALRALAGEAEASGRRTAEIDIKRRLVASDPLAERAATELVRSLAAAGDWAGAVRAAREFTDRVREELPGVPVRNLERLVERLREDSSLAANEDANGDGDPARYRVERELGQGPVATVFLARDRRYDRPVALKLLRPELATATDARRFRREIRVLARLYHPHILPLYDSGVMPAGAERPGMYYVTPYVRGESLRQRLRRDVTLAETDAVAIACDVADALAYAHAQGVVHRDIRPENILLEAGQALVADFGIASVLESAGGESLSASGIVLGVAAYSSPEQARSQRELDGRSDIYALGCVLYEMLSGEPPFTGATRTAILARHVSDTVPSLRTVRADLSIGVERAVLRALAKQPEERFATAGEFAAALRRSELR
jgi:DNA-binding SARP family transcriptional activator